MAGSSQFSIEFAFFVGIFNHNLCEKRWMAVVKMVSRKMDGKNAWAG